MIERGNTLLTLFTVLSPNRLFYITARAMPRRKCFMFNLLPKLILLKTTVLVLVQFIEDVRAVNRNWQYSWLSLSVRWVRLRSGSSGRKVW